MAAMVRPVTHFLALVLLLSGYTGRAQQSPNHYELDTDRTQQSPNLGDILVRLKQNLDQYLITLPNFFCDEHVVSEVRRRLAVKPFSITVTDSIFRIKHTVSEGPTAALVESRDVRRINGVSTKGEDVRGPTVFGEPSLEGLPLSLSNRRPACATISLTPTRDSITQASTRLTS